jgi:hypothetical protein
VATRESSASVASFQHLPSIICLDSVSRQRVMSITRQSAPEVSCRPRRGALMPGAKRAHWATPSCGAPTRSAKLR